MKNLYLTPVLLTSLLITTCCGQVSRDEQLDIPLPKVSDFGSRTDLPKDEVLSWMDAIQARMETLKYDCRMKADISSVQKMNGNKSGPLGWSVALRRARDPSKQAERCVTVRQFPFTNMAIAIGSGVAEDQRLHYDVLQLGDKVLSSNVTSFDYHVSDVTSEVDAKSIVSSLKFLNVFDPIRACTSSVTMVRDGQALEIGQHSVLSHTVKAVLRDGKFVHVLLEISVARSTSKVPLLYTFKDEVPVQVAQWDKVDAKTGRPIPTFLTRSLWKPVKEGKNEHLLPHLIRGSIDLPHVVGDMEIFVEWDLAGDVDDALFKTESLGKLPPAPDVVFDVPRRFEEMVEGVLDK
jgi:hypothetical protein